MNVLEKILEEIEERESYHEELGWVKEVIRSHMDEAKNDDWIPVTKQLPEEDERYKGRKFIDVLVTTARGKVIKVQRQSYKNSWWWGGLYEEPKAWKPLPEPYKRRVNQ